MSSRWRYTLQEAMIGLRRNMLMTVAVILSMTVSLVLLGAGLLLTDQVDLATDDWFDKVEVSIFLCDGNRCPEISAEQQDELREQLESQPIVEQVFYESKQEAYQRFRDQFKDQEDLLESVDPDILPASFRVKLEDPKQFAIIRAQFEAFPGVEDIIDQRAVLEDIIRFADIIRFGAIVVAAFQLVAAAILIANTIRLGAFARREQLSIMKLVGASSWYIRLPFVLEGVIAGVVGAALAWGLLLAVIPWLAERLRGQIEFMPFIGFTEAFWMWPYLFGAGVVIAALASMFALRRFLDV